MPGSAGYSSSHTEQTLFLCGAPLPMARATTEFHCKPDLVRHGGMSERVGQYTGAVGGGSVELAQSGCK